jgi:hypothetical protein
MISARHIVASSEVRDLTIGAWITPNNVRVPMILWEVLRLRSGRRS